jgi:hypothetical protein
MNIGQGHKVHLRRFSRLFAESFFMSYKNEAQRASLSSQQLLASQTCFLALFRPHAIPSSMTTSFWFNIFFQKNTTLRSSQYF